MQNLLWIIFYLKHAFLDQNAEGLNTQTKLIAIAAAENRTSNKDWKLGAKNVCCW